MKVFDTEITDVKIIEPNIYEDERGYFFEAYNAQKFEEVLGVIPKFSQINESFSRRGAIRGLHLQKDPYAQAKLVRVICGEIIDVVLDCRHGSSTFGEHVSVILSSINKRQVWIPRGFAHGFQVLSDTCIFSYQVDNEYCQESEVTIDAFDSNLQINWPLKENIILNKKDRLGVAFLDLNF
jgi:dTDP-4-dehydrorhamnose 3,5-epimerase